MFAITWQYDDVSYVTKEGNFVILTEITYKRRTACALDHSTIKFQISCQKISAFPWVVPHKTTAKAAGIKQQTNTCKVQPERIMINKLKANVIEILDLWHCNDFSGSGGDL